MQCVVVFFSTLQLVVIYGSVLQRAVSTTVCECCSLPRVAVCPDSLIYGSVLQCVAVCCSACQGVTAYRDPLRSIHIRPHVLQRVAVCCSVLQYVTVAECCSVS